MPQIIIIVNAQVKNGRVCATAPVTAKMTLALIKGIRNTQPEADIKIISGADLWSKSVDLPNPSEDIRYCPLTIKLPDWFKFRLSEVYQACDEVDQRRIWVKENFGYRTSKENIFLGDLWLPIIATEKGIVYGEVIGEGEIPNSYQQPVDFPDNWRQPLYRLGYSLLQSINALPSVYLLQFKMLDQEIIFDRLWPFPATPAVASIDIQQPDLFTCHWHCLSAQPFFDIKIFPQSLSNAITPNPSPTGEGNMSISN